MKTATAESPKQEMQRYTALDAYRGLIMFLLVSDGFGFRQLPESSPFRFTYAAPGRRG